MRNKGTFKTAIVALAFAAGTAAAQDMKINSFNTTGSLAWTNVPDGHICFVESSTTLPDVAWSNTALSLTTLQSTVVFMEPAAFYRTSAYSASNLVRYPLTNDANDALGNYGPMILENAPFTNGGIYCNGIYVHDVAPGGSAASTPSLPQLDFDGFVIAVDFMAVTNQTLPIIVGGMLWRWGGIYTDANGKVGLFLNDTGPFSGTASYTTGVWHEAVFVYMASNSTAEVYLDGKLSVRREGILDHHDAWDIRNTHYGSGVTFKGYLRNLRVWNLK